MKKTAIIIYVLFVVMISICSSSFAADKKKLLYIDSYHIEYLWSAEITAGIKSVLADRDDVELKILRMDTKRNKSVDFKEQAALRAKKLIDSWQPDLVIASDDNASKYLIVPYYKDSDLPFVFCGVNWDETVYGFPFANVTGMVEIALYKETIDALSKFAKGDRIGYLASDTVSERKELENIAKRIKVKLNVRFVKTFAELKQAFIDLQKETDLLLLQECRSVQGFDHREMVDFVRENTSVPTGAMQKYLMNYVLISIAKLGAEQGEWAAKTALEILAGKSPEDIPIVRNKKAQIFLNMKIAKKLGIKFPMDLVENANLISAETKKLLYVNSYHKGFKWSDDIEKGLFKALQVKVGADGQLDTSKSEVDVKVFRMDTKRNTSEKFKKKAALAAKAIIDEWQPDIVVLSDDNATKYLLVPYYKNSELPFVFCGVNWGAKVYGLPVANVTGMIEVSPVRATLELLGNYASGRRVGYIGSDNLSSNRNVNNITRVMGANFADGKLVATFAQWQTEYLRLQNTVDMLLWLNPIGIKGWDTIAANDFILANSKIPTGGTSDNNVRFALLGRVKIAEEQGWWAGNTAIDILGGADPAEIPIAENQESTLYLNMALAGNMGVKFPMELIEKAVFLDNISGDKQGK